MADGSIVEKTFGGGGKLERERIVEPDEIEPNWTKPIYVDVDAKHAHSLQAYYKLMHSTATVSVPVTISDEIDSYEADIVAKRIENKLQIKNKMKNSQSVSIASAMDFIKKKFSK